MGGEPMAAVLVVGSQQRRVLAAAEALTGQGFEVRVSHARSAAMSLGSPPPALVIIIVGTATDEDPIALVRYVTRTSCAAVIVCDDGPAPGLAIRALEAGADDCVRGTCSARELSLRARAILARTESNSPPA